MTTRIQNADSHGLAQAIVPGSRVRQSAETVPVGGPRPVVTHEPVVELVKEGEVVQAIDVTCACGQKTRVWCVYEPE